MQCSELSNNNKDYLILETAGGEIVLDQWIKTQDGWVARVGFICQQKNDRAYILTWSKKTRDVNDLCNELEHPLKDITQATGKAMHLKVTGTFQ